MEKNIIKSGLKNTIYVVIAQSISFVLGIAKNLILPILLGVTYFGYWQVYLLYVSYVGLFSLGFNDGVYLRYGKYNYQDLPKQKFRSSIKLFIIIQLIVTVLVSFLILLEPDRNKQISMLWVSINIPISGLTGILVHVLQVTNQLKKYSFYTVLDKIIMLNIIFIMFIFKSDNFKLAIISDTFSKLVVLGLLVFSCKELVFGPGSDLKTALQETYKNISVGIKLMFANLAGMLILGFGRFIVERFESVQVFGTYSFAISTMNLLLVFVAAIGLVIYPTLSRLEENRYSKYFVDLNKILCVLIFVLLIFYFPLEIFINSYMKSYIQIFEYLPIVFAIIFIQTKMQILINPYYKLLREEKAMLRANAGGLLMTVIIILTLYMISKSVFMIAIGTFLAMTIRLYLSEIYLKKELNIKMNTNILLEIIGVSLFILFTYQKNVVFGFLGYFIFLSIYVFRNITTLRRFLKYFLRG